MQIRYSQRNVNAWLIAGILCINTFSKILTIFIYIPFNIVIMETMLLMALVMMNKQKLPLTRKLIIILIVVAGIMGYSLILWRFDSRVIERLLKFIMYALFPMLCIQFPFSKNALIKAIFYIGFIHVVYLYVYAVPMIKRGLMLLNTSMDLSYGSLTYLIAAFFVLTGKKERIVNRLFAFAMCAAIIYFMTIISMNRGSLVAMACFFALFIVTKVKRLSFRIFYFVVIVISAIVIYENIIPILEAADRFTTSHGVVINPLRKTIQQMTYGDSMTSNREVVFAAALDMIKRTWALPNGVASYHIVTNVAYYPHNIFLEAGVEFGFIGIILAAIVIIRACYLIVYMPRNYNRLILMFFCLSIPRLMVSSSYWENSYIWPMMMLMWSTDT